MVLIITSTEYEETYLINEMFIKQNTKCLGKMEIILQDAETLNRIGSNWFFGLCPSFRIKKNTIENNVSESGSASFLR
jgi:hypothetical protein